MTQDQVIALLIGSGLLGNIIAVMMIDDVNRNLSPEQKFSMFWVKNIFQFGRLWKEHEKQYPHSKKRVVLGVAVLLLCSGPFFVIAVG